MRIGILGGTFDPIHIGHLALAHAAFQKLKLERVLFIPSFISPLASQEKWNTPGELRLDLVKAAISGNNRFEVSDIEIKRRGVSYTVDTLRELKRLYPPPSEFYLLVGSDWGKKLKDWKEIDAMASLCQLIVATRPQFDISELPSFAQTLEITPVDISSSGIRQMIREGKDVTQWVPAPVLQMIQKRGLYQT